MNLRALVLITLSCSLVAAPPATAASKKKAKTVKCKSTQVKVTVAKKTTCVKASSFKAVTPKADRSLAATRTVVGVGVPKFKPVKLRNGKSSSATFSTKEQNAVGNWAQQAQQKLRAAAISAAQAGGLTIGGAATPSSGITAKSAWTARAAAGGVKLGDPQVTVNVNQSTGEASVSGKIEGTVELDGGATMDVDMTVSGSIGGASGTGNLSFEIGGTVSEKGKTGSRRVKMEMDPNAKRDTCPDSSGKIEYSTPYSGELSSTDTYKAGPITYGSISRSSSAKSRVRSKVTMKDDATLPKVQFEVLSDLRVKEVVKLVGIPLRNQSVNAMVTATGSLDAKTRAPDPGMKLDVNVSVKGFSSTEAAQVKADFKKVGEEQVKAALGELAQHMKSVESSAQGGKCTKLSFNPTTGDAIGKDEQAFTSAHLTAPKDGDKDVTPKISWTLTPEVGKASGGEGGSSPAQLTVTGAQANPDAARVRVKAVSHSGISEATFTAPAKPPFPKTYSGPVSFRRYRDNHGQTHETTGQGTATYTLRTARSFSDGTMTGAYDLTTLNIGNVTDVAIDADCTTTLPPYAPGSVPVTGSYLSLRISPSGDWTYIATAYYSLGILQGSRHCTVSGFTNPATIVPVFDFSTIGPAFGDSRSMSPKGTISGNVVNGIWTGASDTTGDGTWNLTPGN